MKILEGHKGRCMVDQFRLKLSEVNEQEFFVIFQRFKERREVIFLYGESRRDPVCILKGQKRLEFIKAWSVFKEIKR